MYSHRGNGNYAEKHSNMRLYDTLTRSKREFTAVGSSVKIYLCGVTVYDQPHLGHALSAVVFDVLHRYLVWRGNKVQLVVNFTDVDDKIIYRAAERSMTPRALADRHIQDYFEMLQALNVLKASSYPKATDSIPQIVTLIETLISKGAAYPNGGSVYFRVASFKDYGALSHRSIDDMVTPESTDGNNITALKEHPSDFALWKRATPNEPQWDSPWGAGRPGWHIECSAMANSYLGPQIDIHGGGIDLIFPHHENEIAQSEMALEVKPFANFWMHHGLLRTQDGEKMSKSLGNSIYTQEVLTRFSADAVRLWMLQSNYRSPLLMEEKSIAMAESAIRAVHVAVTMPNEKPNAESTNTTLDSNTFKEQFVQAMNDDLSTPRAVAVLFKLRQAIGSAAQRGLNIAPAQQTLRELTSVLGLTLAINPKDIPSTNEVAKLPLSVIEELLEQRHTARQEGRYQEADDIREQLTQAGIAIHDTPAGPKWERLKP